MNVPQIIVIHHSLTKDGQVNDFNAIKNYHINTKGWQDIGYNYLIEYENGKVLVKKGREENVIGAHTLGQNEKSIGICVVGNFDITIPTDEEIEVLINLIREIYSRYGKLPIHFHNEFANKTCPGKLFLGQTTLQDMVDKVEPKPILNELLRKGSKGEQVKVLQRLLKAYGYNIIVDGDFGKLTEGWVKAYQIKNNLKCDGIVGNMTWGKLKSAN